MGTALAVCAVAAALAGCGDDGTTAATTAAPSAAGSQLALPDSTSPAGDRLLPVGGLTVGVLTGDTTGGPLLARAYVVVAPDGTARLCDALAESSPPQCGGASIVVTGLPPELVDGLQARSGVRWSEAPVQLIGTVADGVFVNDPVALAAS